MREEFSVGISVFLQTLTVFLLKECSINYLQGQKINSSVFNNFFTNRQNLKQVYQWAKDIGTDVDFYLHFTVMLSGYLAKVGVVESALCLPERNDD